MNNPEKKGTSMSNGVELAAGSLLATVAVVAQASGIDTGLDAPGLADVILRAGPSGVLGAITVYSLYRAGKTAEMLAATFKDTLTNVEESHKAASKQFSEDVDRLVAADSHRMEILDKALQHCASKNGRPL